ncbi:MAG: hypothetical protein WAQ28_03485 [Bacteroidia bacterium]
MGYDKFSVESVFIRESTNTKTINAQNQFYYLISESVNPGLVIIADNNLFNDSENFGSYNFAYLQEFTGQIDISKTASANDLVLEFIRVIPEC